MTAEPADLLTVLHGYLRDARRRVLSGLDDLSEYDRRRPMTPTGTNLLGVVKHLSGMEYVYLGVTFGRTLPEPHPGGDDPRNNGDMWARPEESTEDIVGRYHLACAHGDETIRLLGDLDSPGSVPHWSPDRRATTLGAMMIRVFGEESAHGGHVAIVRELIDGRGGEDHTGFGDARRWREYVGTVQAAADVFADRTDR